MLANKKQCQSYRLIQAMVNGDSLSDRYKQKHMAYRAFFFFAFIHHKA